MARFEREVLLRRLGEVDAQVQELTALLRRDDWTEEALASKEFAPLGERIDRLWGAVYGRPDRSVRMVWLEALHRAAGLDIAWREANGEPIPDADEMTLRVARALDAKICERGTLKGAARPTVEHRIRFVRWVVDLQHAERSDEITDPQIAEALDVVMRRGGHGSGQRKWPALAELFRGAGLFAGAPATLESEWDEHRAGKY